MKYLNLQKEYILEVEKKFRRKYGIDLGKNYSNLYIRLKYLYNNYVGALFAYLAIKLGLSANFITYFNIVLGIIGMTIFIFDLNDCKLIGILIFFSKNILDNVDGFVARFKKETSDFGDKLDFYSALVYYFVIIFSLALNNYYNSSELYIFIISILIILLDIFNPIKLKGLKPKLYKVKNKIYKNKLYSFLRFTNYDGRTSITDFILIVMIFEIYSQTFILSKVLLTSFLLFKFSRN
jgi:hypothetical protein